MVFPEETCVPRDSAPRADPAAAAGATHPLRWVLREAGVALVPAYLRIPQKAQARLGIGTPLGWHGCELQVIRTLHEIRCLWLVYDDVLGEGAVSSRIVMWCACHVTNYGGYTACLSPSSLTSVCGKCQFGLAKTQKQKAKSSTSYSLTACRASLHAPGTQALATCTETKVGSHFLALAQILRKKTWDIYKSQDAIVPRPTFICIYTSSTLRFKHINYFFSSLPFYFYLLLYIFFILHFSLIFFSFRFSFPLFFDLFFVISVVLAIF